MRIFKIKLPLLAAITAVVFTVGTTAFTKIGNPPATYTFAYQLSTFDQANVENQANWTLGTPNCNPNNVKACQMTVDAAYTHINPLTQQPELNTTTSQGPVLDIQTGTSNQTDFYVEATTDATNIINKN
jgi:hypothetical protein